MIALDLLFCIQQDYKIFEKKITNIVCLEDSVQKNITVYIVDLQKKMIVFQSADSPEKVVTVDQFCSILKDHQEFHLKKRSLEQRETDVFGCRVENGTLLI